MKIFFRENKVVTCETLFLVIGPFCTHHSICLNIGFWYGSFSWKSCVSNLNAFNYKVVPQFFGKDFHFPEYLFQSYRWRIEDVQNFHWLSYKNMPISQCRFLEEHMLFLLALNQTSKKKRFPVLRQKPTQLLP